MKPIVMTNPLGPPMHFQSKFPLGRDLVQLPDARAHTRWSTSAMVSSPPEVKFKTCF